MKGHIIKICEIPVYVRCPYCSYDDWTSINHETLKRECECENCNKKYLVDLSNNEN